MSIGGGSMPMTRKTKYINEVGKTKKPRSAASRPQRRHLDPWPERVRSAIFKPSRQVGAR